MLSNYSKLCKERMKSFLDLERTSFRAKFLNALLMVGTHSIVILNDFVA
jgi:hypothetical protein